MSKEPDREIQLCTTFVADGIEAIEDVFKIVKTPDGQLSLVNKAIVFSRHHKKSSGPDRVTIAYDQYDPKNPRSWLQLVSWLKLLKSEVLKNSV